MTSIEIAASLFQLPPVQAATVTFYDAMDAASTPEEIWARFLVRRIIRRFIEKYRPEPAYYDDDDEDDDDYEQDDCCQECGGYSTIYCSTCTPDKVIFCHACGRDATDSDWAWTGHCSRWCATSYDREDRRRGRW